MDPQTDSKLTPDLLAQQEVSKQTVKDIKEIASAIKKGTPERNSPIDYSKWFSANFDLAQPETMDHLQASYPNLANELLSHGGKEIYGFRVINNPTVDYLSLGILGRPDSSGVINEQFGIHSVGGNFTYTNLDKKISLADIEAHHSIVSDILKFVSAVKAPPQAPKPTFSYV